MHLKNLDEALNKLLPQPSSIHNLMSSIASERFSQHIVPEVFDAIESNIIEDDLKKLNRIAEDYEFAEFGSTSNFLVTQSLKNLVRPVPVGVIMGSKGAGKTYTYLQLAHLKEWNKFVEKVGDDITWFLYHRSHGVCAPNRCQT